MKKKDEPKATGLPLVGEVLTVEKVVDFHDKVHGLRVLVTVRAADGTKMTLEVCPTSQY